MGDRIVFRLLLQHLAVIMAAMEPTPHAASEMLRQLMEELASHCDRMDMLVDKQYGITQPQ